MKYTMKYFEENKKVVIEDFYGAAYDLDGHRIGVRPCDRTMRRYYTVLVDGVAIATRAKLSNTIRLALGYMEENFGKEPTSAKVELLAFTGMKISEFSAELKDGEYIVITAKGAELHFDTNGKQLNAKNPKFGNTIKFLAAE